MPPASPCRDDYSKAQTAEPLTALVVGVVGDYRYKAWGNRYIQVRLPSAGNTSYNRGSHNVGYIRYDNDGTVSLENQYANTDGSESFTNGNTIYVPVVTRPNSTFENNIISKAFICSEIGSI